MHAWWAYVEDRALTWCADPPRRATDSLDELVAHCERVLAALCAESEPAGLLAPDHVPGSPSVLP